MIKNVKWVRIAALFLGFVGSNILLPNNAFVSIAQSRFDTSNLEGTEWQKEPDVAVIGTAIADIDRFFAFGGQGKVLLISSAVIGLDYSSGPIGSTSYGYRTPPASAETKTAGKYTKTGNLVYIEFPDAIVKATIKGNVLLAEITYKDTSKGKEQWVMHKISNDAGSGTNALSKQSTMSQFPTLSQQVVEKYKPASLTTNVLSGELRDENSGKYHYYTFIAGPGEITFTLFLESYPQATSNGIGFTLFDNNERWMGAGVTMSIPSMPSQNVTKINIPSKQPMLLRIEEKVNNGLGKYRIQLDGAFETRTQPNRTVSNALSMSNKAEKRQLAETLSAQTMTLKRQANDLKSEGKTREAQERFREAIGIFGKIIEIKLDTKHYIIDAYFNRGMVKLELEDYKGAIEDFSNAIEISTPLKQAAIKSYSEAEAKVKSSSKDPVIQAAQWSALKEKIKPEERAAKNALTDGYYYRAIIKKYKLGDKAGACEDYRMYWALAFGDNGKMPDEYCN